ncbi:MAG: type I secretion system permease/ATPase [Rhodoferax sp.]|nr:type I secretion system permease/ATPase [Rhodoferax sp.]
MNTSTTSTLSRSDIRPANGGKTGSKTGTVSELRQVLWSFRREFVMVGCLSMLANVLMLTPTLYMLQVYDRVMSSHSELTLLAVSLLTMGLFAVMGLAEWLRSRMLVTAGVRLDNQLGSRVFHASFAAHLNQADTNPGRAFSDLITVRQFITGNGTLALFDLPWAPIYLAVLFLLHPMLGWLSIVFALIQGLLVWLGHRGSIKPSEEASQAQSDTNLYLQSKLRNSEVVEALGMSPQLQAKWQEKHVRELELHAQAGGKVGRMTAISKFVRYTQQSLALGAGALLVINGELSPGAMIAANVLMSRALAPIDMLVSIWRGFIGARLAFERLETLLDMHPAAPSTRQQTPPRGALQLKQVGATAPGREKPILKDINLQIEPGQVLVVMGPSGSGKTTLAKTMIGIWPDVQGQVLLDQVTLSSWDRTALGPHIGYLPQDIELFDGSIADNIARLNAVNPDKVILAAQQTGLHEAILRFPKGYDTPVGEAGSLLSGGQRQRLGLARALYGQPQLVVLDEPNANLDDAGEAALSNAISKLKTAGKTVVLITHRPAALAVADLLLILRDGQVLYNGPRDVVLKELNAAAARANSAQAAT